jgi:NAD(P)-dependent dehydrogenase (short-subunit alcohol dehydrogenase family)
MHIIVTGASRGIGQALARELALKGHHLILISRNATRLEQVARECNQVAGKPVAAAFPFDLGELGQLETEFMARLRAFSSRVDALVNNAGSLVNKPFLDTTEAEARAMFDANFFAPARLCRLVQPLMQGSSLKHMVNVSSMAGFQGSGKFPGLSYYSASKAAVASLSECLASEWEEEGVRVNALGLGAVQTQMLAEAFPGFKAPLEPEEMARFMAWFVLEGGRYFNGKMLPVSVSTP